MPTQKEISATETEREPKKSQGKTVKIVWEKSVDDKTPLKVENGGKRKLADAEKPKLYDAVFEMQGKARGEKHVQEQHQHKHSHEDVFSIESNVEWNEPLTEDELNSPFAYTLLTTIIFGLSIIGFGVAYDLHFFQDKTYDFIYLERKFPATSAYLMFLACGLGVLSGITGFLIIFCGWSSLFHIFHHSLWLISALNLLATLYAMGIETEPTAGVYHRLFEASSLAMMDDFTYIDIWGKQYRFIWNVIQKELKCCGVHDPEDWLRSPFKQIPKSCCSHYRGEKCENQIRIWNDLPENSRNYSDISSLLNMEGCLDSVRVEWKAMRWDWVVYPIIIFIFHTLTSINLNLLTKVLEGQFRTVVGQDILKEFREYMKIRLISFCCLPCKICGNLWRPGPDDDLPENNPSAIITLHHSIKKIVSDASSSTSSSSSSSFSSSTEEVTPVNSAEARAQRKARYQKTLTKGFY